MNAEYEKMLTMHGQEMEIPKYEDDTEAEKEEVSDHVESIQKNLNEIEKNKCTKERFR